MSEQQITLGAGCFWCVENIFARIKGVKVPLAVTLTAILKTRLMNKYAQVILTMLKLCS